MIFEGMTFFEGKERQTAKVNITISMGNGIPNTVFKLLLQKTPYHLT